MRPLCNLHEPKVKESVPHHSRQVGEGGESYAPPMPLDSLEGDKSDLKNVLPTRSPSVSIRLTPFSLSQPFAD